MNLQTINNWAQLGATLFVAVGIVLVVVEMRQAKQIAAAGATAGSVQGILELTSDVGGERFAESISTLCLNPEKLTGTDYVVLDSYFLSMWYQAFQAREVEAAGEFGIPTQAISEGFFHQIARSEHGRWWLDWRIKYWNLDSETRASIERAKRSGSERDCTTYFNAFSELK